MAKAFKVAYIVSHPIQYQAPLLRYIVNHSNIDLKVFFLSDFSLREYKDEGFGAAVEWDVPLVEGYAHTFLPAIGSKDSVTPLRPIALPFWHRLHSYDVVWLHGYAHVTNLRALIAAKLMGKKVLLRADAQMESALRKGSSAKTRVKETALRRIFAMADGFLSIGKLNGDYYEHYGVPKERIFEMPYAVDNEFFRNKCAEAHPQREQLRQSLGLAAGRPVILYASKFVGRKRAGDVLEAYIKLSPDGKSEPSPYLLFVGDGEDRAKLEARSAETGWSSIKFLGFKNQTELPALFDLCDVFVLVSEREPWGLVVNEVMNAAKPLILSTGVGAAPDLVHEGENGFVIPIGDVEALTLRFKDVLRSPEWSHAMGQKSLEIIKHWGFQENLMALQGALETVMSR